MLIYLFTLWFIYLFCDCYFFIALSPVILTE
jgi:hypothetical protein